MGSDDTYLLTASEALANIRAGGMTIEAYARSLLRRIDVRDVDVGAWAYIDKDYILQQARDLDKVPMSKRGPLHGMPIAIKDVIYTKGKPSLATAEEREMEETEGCKEEKQRECHVAIARSNDGTAHNMCNNVCMLCFSRRGETRQQTRCTAAVWKHAPMLSLFVLERLVSTIGSMFY